MIRIPFFPIRHPFLDFFVHRSGVPLLLYLYCLTLVTDPGREIWALMFSVAVLVFFERLVAGRAMSQPFWTLGVAFLAAPTAAFVSTLTMLEADTLVTALGRTSVVIDFERRLEQIWTSEGTCVLLLAFWLLWALGSTLQGCTRNSGVAITAAERRARAFLVFSALGFALTLVVASFVLGELRESMKDSGWEAFPRRERLSFSHPLLRDQKPYKVAERYIPYREEVRIPKTDHLSMLGSVADDIWAKRFSLTQSEAYLVWRLARSLSRVEPGDPRSARFAAAALAHSRHWRLGCTEELTAQFRRHTVCYLASPSSSSAELRDYRKWIPYLELHDGGGRERQDLALVMSRKLKLWGYQWETSLAELYYALDHLVFPPHEPLAAGLNPESELLLAVLAIRGGQLRTGKLPRHYPLSPEVGEYRLNSFGEAKVVLWEIDPVCRPATVVNFSSVNASVRERGSRKDDKANGRGRHPQGKSGRL